MSKALLLGAGSGGAAAAAASYLLLNGATDSYVQTSPNDQAPFDITGDIDLRIACRSALWIDPADQRTLLSKWGASGTRSYWFNIEPDGTLALRTTVSGSTIVLQASSAPGLTNNQNYGLRATLDVVSGTDRVYTFYKKDTTPATATADIAANTGWTTISSHTVAGTTSIFNSTSKFAIGATGISTATDLFIGRVYAIQVRNGIDGTIVADLEFTTREPSTTDDLPLTDAAGNTYVMRAGAEIAA